MFSNKLISIIFLLFMAFICLTIPTVRMRAVAAYHIARLHMQPFPTANSLPNPVPKQRFIDTWGAARSNGRKHEGVDIFAKRGTPVISNIDGVVWKLEENRLGGTSVWLYGAGGTLHYYTHLNAYAENLHEYQIIKRGDVIAYVGNSGNAKTTPPHLHYGIYLNGKAVNPYPLLNKQS